MRTTKATAAGKELITGFYQAEEFTYLLLRSAEVSQQFIGLLAGREREQQLVEMAHHPLRRRVANALLRLHASADPHVHLTREGLAAVVATASESLIPTGRLAAGN